MIDNEPTYERQRPSSGGSSIINTKVIGFDDLEQLLDHSHKNNHMERSMNPALASVRTGGSAAGGDGEMQSSRSSYTSKIKSTTQYDTSKYGSMQRPTVESLMDELDRSQLPKSSQEHYSSHGSLPHSTHSPTRSQPRSARAYHQSQSSSYHQQSSGSLHKKPDAGSVSKDLDKLLSSLQGFDIKACKKSESPTGEFTYTWKKTAPLPVPRGDEDSELLKRKKMNGSAHMSRHPNELDSMLGSLSADMNKHGIQTVPKGDCAACGKVIIGQVVLAMGKMWHPEHFNCCQCGEELGQRPYFERGGRAFCENDYHNMFSPRCAYCNGAIKDKCVTALERTWHIDHFFCAQCGREFGDEGFHERDGKAYCRQDYFAMFAPKCKGCQKAIQANFITALNTHWHPECFVCQDCRRGFHGGAFYEHNGRPYCDQHYHAQRGTLCAACDKPVTGRCVTAMEKKFHPEHFTCSFCRRELNKGTFKEYEHKPYCHRCWGKLSMQ